MKHFLQFLNTELLTGNFLVITLTHAVTVICENSSNGAYLRIRVMRVLKPIPILLGKNVKKDLGQAISPSQGRHTEKDSLTVCS